jgi:hypothetical protein
MVVLLAIICGVVALLTVSTEIPAAVAAFLRACIPVIEAIHEVRDAVRRSSKK